jgi:thiamine-phosphate pyrophosphorylase
MPATRTETMRRFFGTLGRGEVDAALALTTEDGILDRRLSNAPWRGIARGRDAMRKAYEELTDAVEGVTWEPTEVREVGRDMVAIGTRLRVRGRASGVDVMAVGGWLIAFDGDLIREGVLHQSFEDALLAARRRRLAEARLYFVCEALPDPREQASLLDAALAGGVDLIQLRDKDADDRALVTTAAAFRDAADRHGALFFLNDRPDLVAACDADGVHVGQDDVTVAEARLRAKGALVGLSTHSPAQFDAALAATQDQRPDQLSVGPVWETPTKPGRAAAGLELVRHAAAAAGDAPAWFAIGGIEPGNIAQVVAAGARRVVVVRAIRDASDPGAVASELRAALN